MSDLVLKAEGISRRFGGVLALDKLDLNIRKGDVVGLIGPNGSGKTTFFNVLTGIYLANEGRIQFYKDDVTNIPASAVFRSGIARTFQRVRLCTSLSVFDNIVIGQAPSLRQGIFFNLFQRKKFENEYYRRLQQVEDMLERFAPHLLSKIHEPVSTLPMIDRRRIEVCRALFSNPKLLLLDEPSAGMTEEETRQLMDEVLEQKNRRDDLTIVIVEHEMELISSITDHCVVLNFGKKICEGTYEEIAADKEVQEAYLGVE